MFSRIHHLSYLLSPRFLLWLCSWVLFPRCLLFIIPDTLRISEVQGLVFSTISKWGIPSLMVPGLEFSASHP